MNEGVLQSDAALLLPVGPDVPHGAVGLKMDGAGNEIPWDVQPVQLGVVFFYIGFVVGDDDQAGGHPVQEFIKVYLDIMKVQ